jgi:hypothetical protein
VELDSIAVQEGAAARERHELSASVPFVAGTARLGVREA